MGTYNDTVTEKQFLEQDSKFLPVGGETCQLSPFSECPNSLTELKKMHWSFLNLDYNNTVLSNWRNEGCMVQVQKELGYRYYLKSADIQDSSKAGAELDINVTLFNMGFSNPFNPRKLEFILRNKISGKIFVFDTKEEPRFWNLNQDINLSYKTGLPDNLPEGNYDLLLNMPDPETSLYDNPDYSIQLANLGLWEKTTGFNSLSHIITISSKSSAKKFTGDNFFQEKNSEVLNYTNVKIDGNLGNWQNIDTLAFAQNQGSSILKAFNSNDSIYILVTGNNIGFKGSFYIDADANNSTGYNNPLWNTNGLDYKVQNGQLFYFSGPDNNTAGWTLAGNISSSYSGNYYELGIPRSLFSQTKLSETIKLAYENDTAAGKMESSLPVVSGNLPLYNLFIIPHPILSSVYANNVLVYWAANDSSHYQKIQRADGKGVFQDIAEAQPGQIYFRDTKLKSKNPYQYRLYLVKQNASSVASSPISLNTDSAFLYFSQIQVDGNMSDWRSIAPVASNFQQQTHSLRFVNSADSLIFLLEGFNNFNSYALYIDADNNDTTGINSSNWASGGFEYKISNDSLYENVSEFSPLKIKSGE